MVGSERHPLVSLLVRIVGLGVASSWRTTRSATTAGALTQSETPGTPVPAATRGVLFMNLKSGGGKAERFHLVDECKRRGIEPVVLESGMDWLQTVRDVAASGVDVLGMAGGDGSQAMVGTVAAELGLPMVVVPAGTRNHLALDLGLDRDDVVGALDAYGEAVERTMDLADLNGHVFVNNVSLGLYAAIVRSPAYRDAKVDTTLATLPQVLGPDTEPFDLRFTGPDGVEHRAAHVIQISNNPYGKGASRPRLDTHQLGVVALVLGKAHGGAGGLPGRPRVRPPGTLRRAHVVGDANVRGHLRRPRSTSGSTERPRRWNRPCASRSARRRSVCACPNTPSATRQRQRGSAGRKQYASCGKSSSGIPPVSTPERRCQPSALSARLATQHSDERCARTHLAGTARATPRQSP